CRWTPRSPACAGALSRGTSTRRSSWRRGRRWLSGFARFSPWVATRPATSSTSATVSSRRPTRTSSPVSSTSSTPNRLVSGPSGSGDERGGVGWERGTPVWEGGPMAHVVVVGGGITGVSAAWFLRQAGGDDLAITLVEASARL